jgi:hypothetical protein
MALFVVSLRCNLKYSSLWSSTTRLKELVLFRPTIAQIPSLSWSHSSTNASWNDKEIITANMHLMR